MADTTAMSAMRRKAGSSESGPKTVERPRGTDPLHVFGMIRALDGQVRLRAPEQFELSEAAIAQSQVLVNAFRREKPRR